jgi:hypothetical protein
MDSRAGLDTAVEKRAKSLPCLCRESNCGRSGRRLVSVPTEGVRKGGGGGGGDQTVDEKHKKEKGERKLKRFGRRSWKERELGEAERDNRGEDRRVKVKVKLSLCLTKHHTMKAYWGVEV